MSIHFFLYHVQSSIHILTFDSICCYPYIYIYTYILCIYTYIISVQKFIVIHIYTLSFFACVYMPSIIIYFDSYQYIHTYFWCVYIYICTYLYIYVNFSCIWDICEFLPWISHIWSWRLSIHIHLSSMCVYIQNGEDA